MTDHDVAVVGAGLAGLASAAELRRAGVSPIALERTEQVGAAWRARYDRLKLNTSRWTSKLPKARYPRGAPLYPSRDEVIAYLERYAADNDLDIRFGTDVERIDRNDDGWLLRTSAGDLTAQQVVIATGYENTPVIPEWPGREDFKGQLLHAAEYRNAEPFRDRDVLVIGPGCSGMEIAYDLAAGGAGSVGLAVRTHPNIVHRDPRFPADLPPLLLLKLPPRAADAFTRRAPGVLVRGLEEYGLSSPEEGIFARLRREGKAPAIVDEVVIEAIKERRIEIVAGVEAFEEAAVILTDGTRIEPDAVIAATGYRRGLESIVGHLGVLDEQGMPRARGTEPARAGMRFIGYVPRPGGIGYAGKEAKRAAKRIAAELRYPGSLARPREGRPRSAGRTRSHPAP
jgi:NADPH-dependent 2,4-dienoyl-CoA reductase/sulfur reductase-like enzyme